MANVKKVKIRKPGGGYRSACRHTTGKKKGKLAKNSACGLGKTKKRSKKRKR